MARKTKRELVDDFYDKALMIIAEEDFDIVNCGNMKAAEFAMCAASLFRHLVTKRFNVKGWITNNDTVCLTMCNSCEWRVLNDGSRSYISCCRDVATGVTRSLAPIIPADEDLEDISGETVSKMLNMMDQSWFMMKQKEVL